MIVKHVVRILVQVDNSLLKMVDAMHAVTIKFQMLLIITETDVLNQYAHHIKLLIDMDHAKCAHQDKTQTFLGEHVFHYNVDILKLKWRKEIHQYVNHAQLEQEHSTTIQDVELTHVTLEAEDSTF